MLSFRAAAAVATALPCASGSDRPNAATAQWHGSQSSSWSDRQDGASYNEGQNDASTNWHGDWYGRQNAAPFNWHGRQDGASYNEGQNDASTNWYGDWYGRQNAASSNWHGRQDGASTASYDRHNAASTHTDDSETTESSANQREQQGARLRKFLGDSLRSMNPRDDHWLPLCEPTFRAYAADGSFLGITIADQTKWSLARLLGLQWSAGFQGLLFKKSFVDTFSGIVGNGREPGAEERRLLEARLDSVVHGVANLKRTTLDSFHRLPLEDALGATRLEVDDFLLERAFGDTLSKLKRIADAVRNREVSPRHGCEEIQTALVGPEGSVRLAKLDGAEWLTDTVLSDALRLKGAPEDIQTDLKSFVLRYFDEAPLEVKLPMMAGFFETLPGEEISVSEGLTNTMKKCVGAACNFMFSGERSQKVWNFGQDPMMKSVTAALNGAGPVIQKLFQASVSSVEDPGLKELLLGFQSDMHSMSPRDLKSQLQIAYHPDRIVTRLSGDLVVKGALSSDPELGSHLADETFVSPKATAAASVGQGHLVRTISSGRESEQVFLKVKRRFVGEKMQAELRIADGVSAALGLRLRELMEGELDWAQEARYMARAAELYNRPDLYVNAVQVKAALPEANPVTLLMDAVDGETLSSWMERSDSQDDCLVAERVKSSFGVWAEHAMKPHGFFHADTHAGNIMVSNAPNRELTFIDFGNSVETGVQGLAEAFAWLDLSVSIPSSSAGAKLLANAVKRTTGSREDQQHCGDLKTQLTTVRALPKAERIGALVKFLFTQEMKGCVELPHGLVAFTRTLDLWDRIFSTLVDKKTLHGCRSQFVNRDEKSIPAVDHLKATKVVGQMLKSKLKKKMQKTTQGVRHFLARTGEGNGVMASVLASPISSGMDVDEWGNFLREFERV